MLPANADLIDHLDEGRRAFEQALSEVPVERAVEPLDGERWSLIECVEHVAAAERAMFHGLSAARQARTPLQQRDSAILTLGVDRGIRRPSPEHVRPSGQFRTLDEARAAFAAARARTLEFVDQCPVDLRGLETVHPLVGKVSGREMVLLMAIHPWRHAAQIREIVGAAV